MIKTVCICGAGTMGAGIAQVCSLAGLPTTVYDINPSVSSQAKANIEKRLDELLSSKKISFDQRKTALQNLRFSNNNQDCLADLIIEAIVENLEVKRTFFSILQALNGPDTIYASNTSSLSVNSIAEKSLYPPKTIGIHFFNPAPAMKLVELVTTPLSSHPAVSDAIEFITRLGKTVVVCQDSPGFIVNRVARPYYLESLRLLEQSLVDFETIDLILEASGFKMGPFRLMDLIGIDINYTVSSSLYEALNKPSRLRPSTIQEEMIKKSRLGKKSGGGFYSYT